MTGWVGFFCLARESKLGRAQRPAPAPSPANHSLGGTIGLDDGLRTVSSLDPMSSPDPQQEFNSADLTTRSRQSTMMSGAFTVLAGSSRECVVVGDLPAGNLGKHRAE